MGNCEDYILLLKISTGFWGITSMKRAVNCVTILVSKTTISCLFICTPPCSKNNLRQTHSKGEYSRHE